MTCPDCNGPIIMRPRSDGLFDFGCHHCGKRADPKQAITEVSNRSGSDLSADTLELFAGAKVVPEESEALSIGRLYRQARCSLVDSVKMLLECGTRLKAQKDKLSHGEWLPWLEANQDKLGFGARTAQYLMDAASRPFSINQNPGSEIEALAVSRQIWGHREPEESPVSNEFSTNVNPVSDLDESSEPPPDWDEPPESEPKEKKPPSFLKPILDLPQPKTLDDNPRYCHASCCNGETEVRGPWGPHDAQSLLDEKSFPCGYFGKDHKAVLDLLVEVDQRHAIGQLHGGLGRSAIEGIRERRYRGIGQERN